LKLIAGLAQPTQGNVRIDGTCIRELEITTLRARIAYVSQEPVMFDDSIAFNVCYGDAAPDSERLWAALEMAQLADFVAALPEGARTRIGRGGVQLSGGQRQLLAIARACYRDASIVLLDEPTAALDACSEAVLLRSLAKLVHGRTALIVTHRRATMALADRIIRVEGGQTIPDLLPHRSIAAMEDV
jgi:subfamily B ATP-binding cassette protein MsbA